MLRNIAWTFVNLHAIEPTLSRRQRRVDGVETPRHRADAATETTSRRWAWGARNLISAQPVTGAGK